ncbi:3-deoxy-7-phosphoheptulonate synthase [Marinospirillum perlucidum]|uniref:3-deoxy-7-phosphoheptulonate synthase n=1 Tax=Marinospirillum perlucidum TaxID=1982602 RepID=UPI000DF302BE|nr:3-deoxy-7-phosphoheptulonate synthase [Marinospirillum perlucidum]
MNSQLQQQVTSQPLITREQLLQELPLSNRLARQVDQQRAALCQLVAGDDPRFLVVVGPCSVHDREATLDYARRLVALQQEVGDQLLLVMRVYVEKPRTCLGWKGLVNDPQRDGQTDINSGLRVCRQLMLEVAELGLPIATEALNPFLADYFSDLISWYALGARTTESQTHREMASHLPGVLGFKNATDGSIDVAINALKAAAQPQATTVINTQGQLVQFQAAGNPHGHLVLRGGASGPNYRLSQVQAASARLADAGLNPRVLVDASHANCGKVAERQAEVLEDLGLQLGEGSPLLGVMLESFLETGNQPLQAGEGVYGQSMTDPCLGWEASRQALHKLAEQVKLHRCVAEAI